MNAQLQPIKPELAGDAIRTGLDKSSIKRAFLDHLFFLQGKFPRIATPHDHYLALAYVVRDRLLHRWVSSATTYTRQGSRTVAYLSAEFLMGPHLGNNLLNLGILEAARDVMKELGLELESMLAKEAKPGLGNGGLDRLAACYLDFLATLEIPTLGYGIRYEYGIFHQELRNGWQTVTFTRPGTPGSHSASTPSTRWACRPRAALAEVSWRFCPASRDWRYFRRRWMSRATAYAASPCARPSRAISACTCCASRAPPPASSAPATPVPMCAPS